LPAGLVDVATIEPTDAVETVPNIACKADQLTTGGVATGVADTTAGTGGFIVDVPDTRILSSHVIAATISADASTAGCFIRYPQAAVPTAYIKPETNGCLDIQTCTSAIIAIISSIYIITEYIFKPPGYSGIRQ
jgi:hypothetical protein